MSYKRAAGVAVWGVVFQSLGSSALLIYGAAAKDPAALGGGFYSLTGVLAWAVLAVVFDQHRRERMEAIEAENFAAENVVGQSVFESGRADLNAAARRLDGMYRYLLPAAGVIIGVTLIATGLTRFFGAEAVGGIDLFGTGAAERVAQKDNFVPPGQSAIAIAIGLGLAAIGFVFARYVSGMAQTKEWAILRGGAVFAVGLSLTGVLLTVAHTADRVGSDVVLRVLYTALPLAMVLLGAEVFLNLLLDVYRPRGAGEVSQPAFDSRLLGLVAAPDKIAESISDAINYQLGFDVTSSWFYKLLSRWAVVIALFGGLVLWGMTSLAVVEPHQRALVLRFGEPIDEVGPGLHFKAPWPIDELLVPDYLRTEGEGDNERVFVERTATGLRELELGSQPSRDASRSVVWAAAANRPGVRQFIVQPDAAERTFEGIGSGIALISTEIPVVYAVREGELRNYLELGVDAPTREDILENVAKREAQRFLGTLRVEQVLGPGRVEIAAQLKDRIEAAYGRINGGRGAGVDVLKVGLSGAAPPADAVTAFESVIESRQKSAARLAIANQVAVRELAGVIGGPEQAREVAEMIRVREELSRSEGERSDAVVRADVEIRELIERSGGEAADLILQAKADRWERHLSERSRAALYGGQLDAFTAAPAIFRAKRYFESLADAFEGTRLYVIGVDPERTKIRMDLMDEFFTDAFDPLSDLE
ncbi:MAG: hypothetical protein AAF108_00190 [Planctomycetota bacterium]